jgi:hypothetical protein
MTLPDRVSGMLPRIGRLKRQHNMIFRHSSHDQFIGNASFRAIIMNPNLLMPNFRMDDRAMKSLIALPPFMHQHVVITILTNHQVNRDRGIKIQGFDILSENRFQRGTPLIQCAISNTPDTFLREKG